MRGRLHKTVFAEIAMMNAIATRGETPPSPSVAGGFDDDFDEIIVFTKNNKRTEGRVDQPSVFIPCNFENYPSMEDFEQRDAGATLGSKFTLVVHRRSLEDERLINADTGECLVRISDKLLSLRDNLKRVLYKFQFPLYVTNVTPSFGISARPDLYLFTIQDRVRGTE